MVRHIYVDGSAHKGNKESAIGVVVVEDGKVVVTERVSLGLFKKTNTPCIVEYFAILYAFKYLRNQDWLYTDQLDLIENLLLLGKVKDVKKNKVLSRKKLGDKLRHKINALIALKKGVGFCWSRSHCGDRFNNLAHKIAYSEDLTFSQDPYYKNWFDTKTYSVKHINLT